MNAFWHLIHAILTLIFFPWALVWLCCAVSAGNKKRKEDHRLQERQTAALEELARVGQWKGYRD